MKSHGELTTKLADKISLDWKEHGFKVLHDHGPSGENVGEIVSWFGEDYGRGARLSQMDIAILDNSSDKAIALIEIEETNDKPKTLLGDTLCVLMGEHICFGGKRPISVDEHTTLIILGRSEASHDERNEYLCEQVMKIKPSLSTRNSAIGNIVIKSFSGEEGLDALLTTELDQAFKERP